MFTESRDIASDIKAIQEQWFNIHGPPSVISGNVEFGKCDEIISLLNYNNVRFEPHPSHLHKKIGTVERKHAILRQMSQRIYKDSLQAKISPLFPTEILSRTTYLSNIIYEGKLLSAFEMVRGYTPSIAGLPSSPVSSHLRDAHILQQVYALRRAMNDSTGSGLSSHIICRDQKVY